MFLPSALEDLVRTQLHQMTKLLKTGWVMMSILIRGTYFVTFDNFNNYLTILMHSFLHISNKFVCFVHGQWRRLQWKSRKPLCWLWEHCDPGEKRGWLHQQCHVFYLLCRSRYFKFIALSFVFLWHFSAIFQGWSSFTVGASKIASIAKDNVSVSDCSSWTRSGESSFSCSQ